MITAEYHSDGCFIIRMNVPERDIVRKIAFAFSIPEQDTIVAIINRGMDSLSRQLQREADKVTKEREAEEEGWGLKL